MNERVNRIDSMRFSYSDSDNDVGRRRLDREKKLKDEKEKFEAYFQEALKNIKEVNEDD